MVDLLPLAVDLVDFPAVMSARAERKARGRWRQGIQEQWRKEERGARARQSEDREEEGDDVVPVGPKIIK